MYLLARVRKKLNQENDPATNACTPPHARKPQQRGLRTAQKILTAAALLFSAKGVEKTSVDDIVLEADSSKGTFYHHYESKSAVLAALRQNVIDEYEADLDAALAKSAEKDLPLRLDIWVKEACDSYIRSAHKFHDVAWSNYPESRWTVGNTRIIKGLADLLDSGRKQKLFIVKNPNSTATFILRGILGVIDDLILSEKPLKQVKREMIELARQTVGLK